MTEATPESLGFRMPAEWGEHAATWLSWPKNPLTFPEHVLGDVEQVYCQMVRALAAGEVVKILVDDAAAERRAAALLEEGGADMCQVRFFRIPSADVWIRDYGPTFLRHTATGERAAVKWRFNAWGGKYDDILGDDATGDAVVRTLPDRIFRPGIVLEGGSIDVNGLGTVLTTEQCLLNPNRNPRLSRGAIESAVNRHIGASRMIWLKSGIDGDDTDGHVDDFARFVSPRRVLCAWATSDRGGNAAALRENYDILRVARDQDGEPLEVVRLPLPEPLWLEEEKRWLPASYANFYIGNRAVLLPVFGDPMDGEAVAILQSCFPGREVVPIGAVALVYGYGGIHCVTQQEPVAPPAS
ncbi:MAG: agmatine deiminase family protein [Acidobacteriota bacterium]|jgi:agmatine deiminase|nr:agmatine deiminase family protein [Acidobacteriota bacterium]